jgi:hypothetical protein
MLLKYLFDLKNNNKLRPKAKRYRDIDSRLIQLKERLTSGSIDVVQYSDAAPHLLHLD